ncbi:3-hydroxyacyl-[acyl-carrier-protein] dehydratase [Clostridium tetanomorphum]|uniref:3-hydroxyacyl-[acyl-carrier-protein] dehydratase FabZ n=1 Tax=Clostridium tetanomorphum TaxID=1553 RepID=A0A923ED78_CLOTT|nr:3-hydroxyacyl-ACP dehydratase FabZ [Clostridium tetanomorphum]KAJ49296.1 (3R)-hydroxymyristoyl-ACP dehydratase [Clostridium tetanomorphum DSM 665]KAJ53059.1 (3R)-hydroxymyristoyl-ACP dehydratase [Clostridium tetanomorphum DSM 665]MBC2398403.1 3-hydroxyacyl-ACP dehydratase FabZ [Clostridium tetanomorphum]MBP1865556.1 3-hydroxyacyl-[acyl-carrier-protein] dehydratase [Clostridium tetanomorphum]NRS86502.1 3-hydroxyacyl-[acyl-carrier-protein] dehydratase [Clostridium tetanomorphum]
MEKELNIKDIMKIIPHRYPFLLVDKIVQLEPGKKAIGYKNVTMNEYFFQGHFPKEPVMPGVLIIEALAQVGAVAVLSLEQFKDKIAYFAGINKARFRRKVVPGDVLKLEIELIKLKGSAGIASAVATVNGEKAAEAEIMVMIG